MDHRRLQKVEFSSYELSDKAKMAYHVTDGTDFYRDMKTGVYYLWDRCYEPEKIGHIKEVNDYWEWIYDFYDLGNRDNE